MPELPEVETVRRGLAPAMEGATLIKVEQNRPDLRFPFPERFAERLEGRRVLALRRRAKYLLADLDDGTILVMHLGMSGSFRIETESDGSAPGAFHHLRGKNAAHDHVVLHLSGTALPGGENSGRARVLYNDPRRFGFMTLTSLADFETHPLFAHLGVEPVGNSLQPEGVAAMLAGKQAPLKAALLDQTIIAGLGNIYVCEALWRARLSPRRRAGSLVRADGRPTDRLVRLVEAIRTVIAEAIEAGGSTLRDHIKADGSLGYFQHRFAVYDQEGKPCRHEGCGGTITRIVQSGRSTFFCPGCQR
ncbi:DNA-(apurinic or apyrimidinic site) lyase [Faunimonas pinastri]|uniref:Formamidopyrimidine-DNA glycosylase n=1 Tax=Faunimonas pinastri TaxID=1855383 RepID=A0A1H9HQD8_9HYPH|nr:bifunctional DNA-formamidopyrimidine glycosylase/DNA-(apurinic or apyrimidinic site) lyase [Faunimonas pinastri]SEQ64498.1 DNA-(apurinic or apyrimidinic site) lyase [Faunimonas pinastri]